MRNCNSLPNKQPANSLLKKFQFIIATTTIYIANYLWEIPFWLNINLYSIFFINL